jgi:hypothetical protein
MNTLSTDVEHDFFISLFSPAMLDRPAKTVTPKPIYRETPVRRTRVVGSIITSDHDRREEDNERWDGLY